MEREHANFVSMLAHDMRSSLTGIHGLGLRLLRKPEDMDEEKARKHLEIITKEAGKLEALVDDLLELSRIETGRLKLSTTAVSLDKELEEIFETFKEKAAQQGIQLELRVGELLPVIEADANRLRRVFGNLLDNAIKFSRKGGTIVITTQETDREVMVAIRDSGTGIAAEDLPCIFDLFHRGKTALGREGHGLGLATVKAIVEGHGGRIMVASELDIGSTFTVFLPKLSEIKGI
jgi:signal transduction histidine kinase